METTIHLNKELIKNIKVNVLNYFKQNYGVNKISISDDMISFYISQVLYNNIDDLVDIIDTKETLNTYLIKNVMDIIVKRYYHKVISIANTKLKYDNQNRIRTITDSTLLESNRVPCLYKNMDRYIS